MSRLPILVCALALIAGIALLLRPSVDPVEGIDAPAAVGTAPVADAPAIPLDRLLEPPPVEPPIDPLRGGPPRDLAGPEPEPGALDDLIDVEQRSSVSHRGTSVDDTDVSVGVPVSESVKIRGGVRVQEKDTGDDDEPEALTRPIVGVEVEY